ncbi:MAG: YraN family protein [Bacteroidota bacterium]|jgi:putative endonuclease
MKFESNNNAKGKLGELHALNYLIKNNYRILAKNWRHRHLEIDLIAQKDNILVIIEVKLRSSNSYGNPEDFVLLKKQKNLIAAANEYIIQNNLNNETRFDIISIVDSEGSFSLDHIVDAFYPSAS